MSVSNVINLNDLFIRYDDEVGLIIFCKTNGLYYAYAYKEMREDLRSKFLNNDIDEIKRFVSNITLLNNHLLPVEEAWPGWPQQKLNYPLTINWLISNKCTHRCSYCYADDIIEKIDTNDNVSGIAKNILLLKPLNVVLSGGEPLLCNNIKDIIEILADKTGITIDTNGYCYERLIELLPIIKKYNIHIRVSLDTVRIKEMYKTRPIRDKRVNEVECMRKVLSTIGILISNKVNFTVHTVMTKQNANDLSNMGDKLYKLGVKVWRIFELQVNDVNNVKFRNLLFNKKEDTRIRIGIFFKNQLMMKSKNYWKGMDVIYTPAKGDKNNVILVLPNGAFMIQPKHSKEKCLIDPENPFLPQKDALHNLSWGDHFERYIG